MSPPAWFAFLCPPRSSPELVNGAGRQPWALALSWKATRQTSAGQDHCWRWLGRAQEHTGSAGDRSAGPQVPPSVQHPPKRLIFARSGFPYSDNLPA